MSEPNDQRELLKGTLDLLVLKTLTLGPMHGWAIGKRIQQLSEEALSVQQGSLYPALYRLQDQGLVRSRWADSEAGRKVKVYRLTVAGERRLANATAGWRRVSSAVELVLAAKS